MIALFLFLLRKVPNFCFLAPSGLRTLKWHSHHVLKRNYREITANGSKILVLSDIFCQFLMSDRRHLLPSAALLRTVRATFTAYGSSLR
ncbi:hypothetical protein AT251_19855 [Enterovibrio nigricans]|nr:hypothetical protein AT251_19855 [Enterovibrio nigricans]